MTGTPGDMVDGPIVSTAGDTLHGSLEEGGTVVTSDEKYGDIRTPIHCPST